MSLYLQLQPVRHATPLSVGSYRGFVQHEGDVRADGTRHGRGVRVQRGARGEPHKNWPVDTLSLDLARFGMVDEAVSYLVRSVCVLEIDGDVGSVEWYQVQLD
jgi:hypothetical protein